MAKCRCKMKPRIVSSVVRSMGMDGCKCRDVCANPICGEPDKLSIFAPLIYDEIGINLCATFDLNADISTNYPTARTATIKVINATYDYGPDDVQVESIKGRPNCYVVTLSDITIQFAMNLYDDACRLVGTIYPTAVYLPPLATDPTYDEDTNPNSVELEIFAPYGLSYNTTNNPPIPVINYIGFSETNNFVRQGVNLSGIAKLLDFNIDDDTATVGLTLFLQSLYYAAYKVKSAGKINVPKGSIESPEESDCMRFVAGDLLNLAIKPLDLGPYTEQMKEPCESDSGCICNSCMTNHCENDGATTATDDTDVIRRATP